MPLLKEKPELEDHYHPFMKSFSLLCRSEDFSITAIRSLYDIIGLLSEMEFIDVMLTMRMASMEPTRNRIMESKQKTKPKAFKGKK